MLANTLTATAAAVVMETKEAVLFM